VLELVHRLPVAGAEELGLPHRGSVTAARERADVKRLAVHRDARVRVPWQLDLQRSRDQRQDRARCYRPVDNPPRALARQLDEQRDEGDVLDVPLRRPAAVVRMEADAVVRRDDDERTIEEARRLQPVQ
jgi:hypothetical protein